VLIFNSLLYGLHDAVGMFVQVLLAGFAEAGMAGFGHTHWECCG
jgi:hypothetical protein